MGNSSAKYDVKGLIHVINGIAGTSKWVSRIPTTNTVNVEATLKKLLKSSSKTPEDLLDMIENDETGDLIAAVEDMVIHLCPERKSVKLHEVWPINQFHNLLPVFLQCNKTICIALLITDPNMITNVSSAYTSEDAENFRIFLKAVAYNASSLAKQDSDIDPEFFSRYGNNPDYLLALLKINPTLFELMPSDLKSDFSFSHEYPKRFSATHKLEELNEETPLILSKPNEKNSSRSERFFTINASSEYEPESNIFSCLPTCFPCGK